MLASQLLSRLASAIAKYGDRPVYIDQGECIDVAAGLAVIGTHEGITHFAIMDSDGYTGAFDDEFVDHGAAEVD